MVKEVFGEELIEEEHQQQQAEDMPSSSYMIKIKATELFPKEKVEKEDDSLQIPFAELSGEFVKYIGRYDSGILAISNYRLYLSNSTKSFETSIPLRLIENVSIKEMFQLVISCKDACTHVCSFSTNELCNDWHSRISAATSVPDQLENLFAFAFYAWESEKESSHDHESNRLKHAISYDVHFKEELDRLKFDLKGAWRVSNINSDFKLCSSYPKQLIVPACISDETLAAVANFRSSKRIPIVTYRHPSGAVIARSSQPEVGWLGWRNNKDEQLLKALADACSFDNGKINSSSLPTKVESDSDHSLDTSNPEKVDLETPKKILIIDARSYASAVTNRARGGGVECAEYYPNAEIEFMNLGNIHVIRKSFQSLRQLCIDADIPNWFSLLEKTNWLQHISGLLSAANIVVHAIEKNNRPVLVHCSDGWDRTSQISSISQLLLDPYYRTMEGFMVLVEKEWLAFGHKFGDRVGHGVGSDDTNERCPVFLQWIDCVYQIHNQFPCSFEFTTSYLIKLAQHVHSCLFGTFLCNTLKERIENFINERTFSVWPFLSTPIYKNPLYQTTLDKVLWPSHRISSLVFWRELYGGSFHTPHSNGNDNLKISSDTIYTETGLIKTRSFDDLVSEIKSSKDSVRRLSDPSVFADSNTISMRVSILSCDSGTSNGHNDDINNQEKGIKTNINNHILPLCTNNNNHIINNHNNGDINIDELANNEQSTTAKEEMMIQTNLDVKIPECTIVEHQKNNEEKKEIKRGVEKEDENNHEGQEQIADDDLNNKDEIDGHKMIETVENLEQHFKKLKSNFQNGHSKSKKESTSSNDSQFSTPVLRSITPATLEKTISSVDGLSFALSQENLRLQQLVHEYKLKEEKLYYELLVTRRALVNATSCQCGKNQNNQRAHSAATSEDPHQEYNSENSVCSWEAVDEKPNDGHNNHVPWIPDFARSKCKNCQIEFWLGRRRHHCRLCMEIFCADCSDHFAQLPNNENIQCQYPVRLCEPCFKSIVEKETN
ncbi:hypothetical protein PVAND_003835 [Polypedilum vanderplanki]|uniref:phosphatidylinositol-3,5-bisphosphate 3-phosphatase n=1 Tax=Polypedilum vanderplanki TaxID=319348 RepID=A0A9J6BWC0_POLVA|nr:hypothetical protein PVAND_003835 [Polypedilum vanderplanki]